MLEDESEERKQSDELCLSQSVVKGGRQCEVVSDDRGCNRLMEGFVPGEEAVCRCTSGCLGRTAGIAHG